MFKVPKKVATPLAGPHIDLPPNLQKRKRKLKINNGHSPTIHNRHFPSQFPEPERVHIHPGASNQEVLPQNFHRIRKFRLAEPDQLDPSRQPSLLLQFPQLLPREQSPERHISDHLLFQDERDSIRPGKRNAHKP